MPSCPLYAILFIALCASQHCYGTATIAACSLRQHLFFTPPTAAQCPRGPPFTPARIHLLYDVSHYEGFNLRRDVFMRLVVFVRQVRMQPGWSGVRLVLPPFRHLVHWNHEGDGPEATHFWHEYFDLDSMRRYADVLDAWEYNDQVRGKAGAVRYVELSNYDLTESRFEDRFELLADNPRPDVMPTIHGTRNHTVASVHRVRFQGNVRGVQRLVQALWSLCGGGGGEQPGGGTTFTVYLRNAEIVLHDWFGNAEYWRARRSMRFAETLEAHAARFRRDVMRMDVTEDRVQRPQRWEDERPTRSARGGPFVCAHLRRRDFLSAGRVDQTPTLKLAAEQIRLALDLAGLYDVFLSSDCNGYDYRDLVGYLPHIRVHRYRPAAADRLSMGAVAVIDQIICSRARHFIGSHESTFTFRIQEEREILGFAADTTFNTFCGRKAMAAGGGAKCERNSRWLIEYVEQDEEDEEL